MPDVFPPDVHPDYYLNLHALQFFDGTIPLYVGVRGDDCDDLRYNLNRGWTAEFEKEAKGTPSKCLNTTPARGQQFNLGKSTMPTDIVDLPLVTVPKQLQEELGTKKDDCTISFPYPLKHHKHANSTRFEKMTGEAVVLLCKLFEKKWPVLYYIQRNSIHPDDRWPQSYTKKQGNTKVPHSAFNKVNVNRNLGTKFHFDKGNVSGTLCALLMFGDYTGGDQLLMNGVDDTVIRIKNQPYDVCFAQFDGLFHSNEEPLQGTRYAIIPYSNKGLCDYYKVERFLKGIPTGRRQAAGPSDPVMAGEFHAKQLAPILAKHLCENTKQLLNGFKEDTPTLFLALDVMELTTKIEALVTHWGIVSEQDLAVLSYLASAFNPKLFEHVTRHCQTGLNLEARYLHCELAGRVRAKARGEAGTGNRYGSIPQPGLRRAPELVAAAPHQRGAVGDTVFDGTVDYQGGEEQGAQRHGQVYGDGNGASDGVPRLLRHAPGERHQSHFRRRGAHRTGCLRISPQVPRGEGGDAICDARFAALARQGSGSRAHPAKVPQDEQRRVSQARPVPAGVGAHQLQVHTRRV
jgi:hypothetical protein